MIVNTKCPNSPLFTILTSQYKISSIFNFTYFIYFILLYFALFSLYFILQLISLQLKTDPHLCNLILKEFQYRSWEICTWQFHICSPSISTEICCQNLIYFTNCPVVFLNALYPKDWASYYVYVLVIVLTILNFLTSMNFSSQIAHLSHNFQSIKQHFSHYPCFSLYVHLLFLYSILSYLNPSTPYCWP